jgi:hypothetical protein
MFSVAAPPFAHACSCSRTRMNTPCDEPEVKQGQYRQKDRHTGRAMSNGQTVTQSHNHSLTHSLTQTQTQIQTQTQTQTQRHTQTHTHTHTHTPTCAALRLSLAFLAINEDNHSALVTYLSIIATQRRCTGYSDATKDTTHYPRGPHAQVCADTKTAVKAGRRRRVSMFVRAYGADL